MDSNVSVSKGVFVFKNNFQAVKGRKKKNLKINKKNLNIYSNELWYQSYDNLWKHIERKIEILNKTMFSSILTNLVHFIKTSYISDVREIPTAALLTGINMPDHLAQFATLMKKIRHDVSPHVACLYSQECQNVRSCIDNLINQFIHESESSSENTYKITKGQFNFSMLQAWYEEEYCADKENVSSKKFQRNVLVVIIPDFESFNEKILQEFILIISSYINILPFVFVFGIATSLTILHKALPYHVSSKVNIQYFSSQSSSVYLNNILENVFFTNDCAFHLGGKVFNLLLDIFLLYDLSVTGFVKKYKYAMLEHFSYGNIMALCTAKNPLDIISEFDHHDYEVARQLPSFQNLVEGESPENKIKLRTDNDYFKAILYDEICKMKVYLNMFHLFLKCLAALISDLPKNPLGKQIRELYGSAVTSDITKTNNYKTCLQLLQFQSKEELVNKMSEIIKLVKNEWKSSNAKTEMLKKDLEDMYFYFEEMQNSDTCVNETDQLVKEIENVNISNSKDRKQFREILRKRTQPVKQISKYEESKTKLLKFMDELFAKYLSPPTKHRFQEIFFFNDTSIESNIIGFHRGAIHTALNNPHNYLQCQCCKKENEDVILKTMPDICIAYKLHLEYGKMINLYDWLQGFVSIVKSNEANEEDEGNEVDLVLQARFTAAVAELEFLGFIKSSKRKTDHVQRLTWGG